MKKVLITGCAGFIGSNMAKYLLDHSNYKIYGVDNFQSGISNKKFILELLSEDRFAFTECDFKYADLREIEVVYHFAATPRVLYSIENPLLTNENNVSNTLNLLDACKKENVKRFVFSSSSSVYGDAESFPTSEDHRRLPNSPYALQKSIIEDYCRLYSKIYGLDTVCLRYFNVYGPNQYAENAYATVICAWIKGFLQDGHIRLDGDGTQSRDFSYVDDVCKANYMVGEYPHDFKGESFNVACGNSISLVDILEIIKNVSKNSVKISNAESRAGDVFKTHADISKIKSLGFEPKTGINEGVSRTYNWYINNP